MMYWEKPEFIAMEKEERRHQRTGVRRYRPTTADFRHLLPKMDPAILQRMRDNAKKHAQNEED